MRRILRPTLAMLLALIVLALIVLLLSPAARRLAPSWLYYDLMGRRMGGLPAAAEQYLLAEGQAFCSVGRDSACGGYKLVRARQLSLGPNAQSQGASAAWCVDYVVLRRNTSALTGGLIEWSNIPRTVVLVEHAGAYESAQVEGCPIGAWNP